MVVARKAALFASSEGGGKNWATATALMSAAILSGLNPQTWLADVPERMASGEVRSTEPGSLLPWNWRRGCRPRRHTKQQS